MRNRAQIKINHGLQITNYTQGITRYLLIATFILFTAVTVHSQGLIVMAKKVSGEVPSEPSDAMWRDATALSIPLAPQVMAKPRIYESKIKELKVRAIHNTRDIAFLIEWEDPTEDASIDIDKFSDAVALEFPSQTSKEKPHFAMGDKENPINIWFWRAAWQKADEKKRLYAMVDDFAGGLQVGNPVSIKRTYPVENLIAEGFGSVTDIRKAHNQDILAKGIRDGKKWLVIFKRSLTSSDKFEVSFKEGGVIPIAFAVWDGSEGHRGGRKVVSTWYYVGLETEERAGTYVYPVIAFLLTGAIIAILIFAIRKRRGA